MAAFLPLTREQLQPCSTYSVTRRFTYLQPSKGCSGLLPLSAVLHQHPRPLELWVPAFVFSRRKKPAGLGHFHTVPGTSFSFCIVLASQLLINDKPITKRVPCGFLGFPNKSHAPPTFHLPATLLVWRQGVFQTPYRFTCCAPLLAARTA